MMVQLHIMIPEEEKKQAQLDAHRLNVTLSEYIRSLLVSGHNAIERTKNKV